MPPESNGFFTGILERIRGVEQLKSPRWVIVPNSPHFQQYYTEAFFEALDAQIAIDLRRYFLQSTDHAATVPNRGKEINISTSGAATIVRDHLLGPDLERLRRTVLVSGIDQLLSAFYAKDVFQGIEIGGQRFNRDGHLATIMQPLEELKEGDSFRLIARDRKVKVSLLPLPKDEGFQNPEFFLIAPQETKINNAQDLMNQARRSGERVLVEVKKNQFELGLAYLSKFNPDGFFISGITPSGYIRLGEDHHPEYKESLPRPQKGQLQMLIRAREGNVDGLVRATRDNLKRERNVVEVLGIDVVQTGISLRDNKLKRFEPVLPIPVNPVQMRVL